MINRMTVTSIIRAHILALLGYHQMVVYMSDGKLNSLESSTIKNAGPISHCWTFKIKFSSSTPPMHHESQNLQKEHFYQS